jgi:hypothetical protein
MLMTMKANPGGQIDSKTAVGRDQLIELLWEAVDQQSLIITAERRIGKTTVIKKMRDDPAAGWFPVYQDLEGCDYAEEFAMAVYKEIHQFLSRMGKATRRAKELFMALGGNGGRRHLQTARQGKGAMEGCAHAIRRGLD